MCIAMCPCTFTEIQAVLKIIGKPDLIMELNLNPQSDSPNTLYCRDMEVFHLLPAYIYNEKVCVCLCLICLLYVSLMRTFE